MPFKEGESGNPAGRPKGTEAMRPAIRKMMEMTADALEAYQCKNMTEQIARRRVLLAMATDDFRSLDALTDQLEGKPNQPSTIDANVQSNTNPIADAINALAKAQRGDA